MTADSEALGAGSWEPLRLIRRLPGDASLAYAMWTEPDLMRSWLFASDHGTLVHVEADPVVGGTYRILERIGEDEIDHFGRYLVVDPPHRLRFTLDVPKHFSESTDIRVSIIADGNGTRLEFSQTGIDPHKTQPFWCQMLDQLENAVGDHLA